MSSPLRIELSLSTFDASWPDLRSAAVLADGLGIGGVWVMDHLSGSVHGRRHVLECLSVLSGLAACTERARLGSLVLNCGTRHPTVVGQAFATMQLQGAGRMVLGVGAGGGSGTRYADEMTAAGFGDDRAAVRRERVADTIAVVRALWGDDDGRGHAGARFHLGSPAGFLHPDPAPPILVAGFGPKMAALAGSEAEAFNTWARTPALEDLQDTVRAGATREGRPTPELTVYDDADRGWLDPDDPRRRRLAEAGTDTLILVLAPPFDRAFIADIAAASS